jgi:chromosome segregation ATPase
LSQEAFYKRLHELYRYVSSLGEHIIDIHSRINQIEDDINSMKNTHKVANEKNKSALAEIRNTVVTKLEVNDLLQELNSSITGHLPPLSEKLPKKQEQKKPPLKEQEQKKPRFSFFSKG